MGTTYVTSDGEEYEVDNPNDPQTAAWLKQVGAEHKGIRTLKLGGSKLAEGAAKIPFALSDILNLGLDVTEKQLKPEWMQGEGYQDFRKAHKGSKWVDEALGAVGGEFAQPRNSGEEYFASMMGGIGGAGAAGGIGALAKNATAETVKSALPMLLAQGATGGLGAQ